MFHDRRFQSTPPMAEAVLATTAKVMVMVVVALALLAGGCRERKRRPPAEAKAIIARAVQAAPTDPEHKLSFRFDDKVELIGFDLEPDTIVRGQPFTVTWHWKVEAPIGPEYQSFTHALDEHGVARVNLDRERELHGIYPPSDWKTGQYVLDRQVITLPGSFKGRGLRLGVGFWRGDERLPVTRGKHDDNRVVALSRVINEQARPKPPTLVAARRTQPIALDGKLDEPDWASAPWTAPFVNTMRGTPGAFPARAKVLFDDDAMFIAFEVSDDYLRADHNKRDDHLWEQDTVEVMVDPDGDGKNYFEMQVSPRNVVFDTRYDSRRLPRPFGDLAWSAGIESGVALRGTLDGEAGDQGYTVEMRVPWTAFAHGPTPAKPPAPGDSFAMNFFVMDDQPSGRQRATGWSPPLIGDFHTLDRFGTVRFGERSKAPPSEQPAKPTITTRQAPPSD